MNDEVISKKLLEQVNDVMKIQLNEPWSYTNPYMQGMANGMLVIHSILTGETPEFLSIKKSKYSNRK